MDKMLRALADGTRREILALVWRDECAASDIASRFSMSRPAISQHLQVLLGSELVSMRRAGTRRLYRANHKALARLRAELDLLWDDALVRLKRAAETAERRKRR